MMLYTKYESSGPCSFRQEDFHFKTYLLTRDLLMQPTDSLNKLDREPPRDHSCEVWSNSH